MSTALTTFRLSAVSEEFVPGLVSRSVSSVTGHASVPTTMLGVSASTADAGTSSDACVPSVCVPGVSVPTTSIHVTTTRMSDGTSVGTKVAGIPVPGSASDGACSEFSMCDSSLGGWNTAWYCEVCHGAAFRSVHH